MAYCPSCGDEIATDALSCSTCDAVFGANSAWQALVEPPPDRDLERIAEFRAIAEERRQRREQPVSNEPETKPYEVPWSVVETVRLLLAGGGWFFLWLTWYTVGPRDQDAIVWRVAAVVGAVLTAVIAIRAKLRWMLLVLFGSFALFFTSCAVHFRWGG